MYEIEKKVYMFKCPKCGQLHYPAPARCKKCGYRRYPEQDVEPYWQKKEYTFWQKIPLKGKCKLLSYTRLWSLPPGFPQQYIDFGLVEFENGIRAIGHLLVDNPQLNMELKAEPGIVKEYRGKIYYGLKFFKTK